MQVTQPGRELDRLPERPPEIARREHPAHRMHPRDALLPKSRKRLGVSFSRGTQHLGATASAGMAKSSVQQEFGSALRTRFRHGGDGFPDDDSVPNHRRWWPPEFLMRVLNYMRHSRSYRESPKG